MSDAGRRSGWQPTVDTPVVVVMGGLRGVGRNRKGGARWRRPAAGQTLAADAPGHATGLNARVNARSQGEFDLGHERLLNAKGVLVVTLVVGVLSLSVEARAQCYPGQSQNEAAHSALIAASGHPNYVWWKAATTNTDTPDLKATCGSGVQSEGWWNGGGPSGYLWKADTATLILQWNFDSPTYGTFHAYSKHWYTYVACEYYVPYVGCVWGSPTFTAWTLAGLDDKETTIAQSEVDGDGDNFSSDEGDCDDFDPESYPGGNTDCSDSYLRGDDRDCDGARDSDEYGTCPNSPLIIDVAGNGFSLTDRAHGVLFDLNDNGTKEQIPWTSLGSDDAWLALDRNGNGIIDNGAEMFGNFTSQPPSSNPNGFSALAVFDSPRQGGNGDGWIDDGDAVYSRLMLWTDANHDGVSQPTELVGPQQAGVRRIALSYREFRRIDQAGNVFRLGARLIDIRGYDMGPLIFDVYFEAARPRSR